MPTHKTLSTLTRVSLREAWKHEAGEFTPWLAEAANFDAPDQRRLTVQRYASRRGGPLRSHWCHKLWHKPRSPGPPEAVLTPQDSHQVSADSHHVGMDSHQVLACRLLAAFERLNVGASVEDERRQVADRGAYP
jgi:hypothetical protein